MRYRGRGARERQTTTSVVLTCKDSTAMAWGRLLTVTDMVLVRLLSGHAQARGWSTRGDAIDAGCRQETGRAAWCSARSPLHPTAALSCQSTPTTAWTTACASSCSIVNTATAPKTTLSARLPSQICTPLAVCQAHCRQHCCTARRPRLAHWGAQHHLLLSRPALPGRPTAQRVPRRFRSRTHPPRTSLHIRPAPSLQRHARRNPSLSLSSERPLCDRLATAPSPTGSSILTPASPTPHHPAAGRLSSSQHCTARNCTPRHGSAVRLHYPRVLLRHRRRKRKLGRSKSSPMQCLLPSQACADQLHPISYHVGLCTRLGTPKQ
jgi:hypothetical protein